MKIIKFKNLFNLFIFLILLLIPCSIISAGVLEDKEISEQKINEFKQSIEKAQGNISMILEKVRAVEDEMSFIKTSINDLNSRKEYLFNLIKNKEIELKKMIKEFNTKKNNVYNIFRQVYEEGEMNYLSIVFESKNLTEFINNTEYYLIIRNKQIEKINEIKKEREKIEKEKKVLDNVYKELEENKKNLEKKKNNLEIENNKLNSSKEEIEKAKNVFIEELREEQAALARLSEEIPHAINQNSMASEYIGNGRFAWPVPSSRYITTYYEWRWGEFHPGIDVGANYGAPIVAADEGYVVMSGDNGDGFGNKVILDHGGGVLTLYGHMSYSIPVKSHVQKGQYIGNIGSTGRSTGPHLHFQATFNYRVFETAYTVDPMQYF